MRPWAMALVLLGLSGTAAFAEEQPPKRPIPDYDGRGDPPPDAGDVLLYVPRIILFPAYVVSEYAVRRPMQWLVVSAEKGQWPSLILDFFTFEDRKIGVFPTGLVDFGFRPSIGVYTFWNDFVAERNDIRFSAATGGSNYFTAHLTDRVRLAEDRGTFSVAFDATRRPDFLFQGIGPEPPADLLGRYRSDRLEALARYDIWLVDEVSFAVQAGVRRLAFNSGSCCGDPSIGDLVAMGRIAAPPPQFGTDFSTYHHGIELAFDTRRPRPAPGTGFRFELGADHAFGLSDALMSPYINYGGAVGGFWDVAGLNRVISLFLSARFVDPTGKGEVPFTDLVTFGGAGLMNGFRPGRLIGRSSIAAQLEYRWPIWVFLDGAIHFAVGDVFGPHLDDFDFKKLRGSVGIGMRTVGRRDQSFNVLVAAGTDTFDRGFAVTDFRFVFGVQRGF